MLIMKMSINNDKTMRRKRKLNSSDNGLTVGELTIAIGALILISLIWSSIQKGAEDKDVNLSFGKILNNEKVFIKR